jgi:hypothetical protein
MILLSPRTVGITERLPSTRFDHAIARIKTAEGWQWVDPTADQLPYGYLPISNQGVPTLIIDPTTTAMTISPIEPPDAEPQVTNIDIALSADGSIKGIYQGDYAGNTAWLIRTAVQAYGVGREDQFAQTMTAALIPNSFSDSFTFKGMDDSDSNLSLILKVHADKYAISAGNLLLLSAPWAEDLSVFEKMLSSPTPRKEPLEIGLDRGAETTTAGVRPTAMAHVCLTFNLRLHTQEHPPVYSICM